MDSIDLIQESNNDTSVVEESYEGTFILPSMLAPRVVIEFCNRCRWLHRANWMATELMLTFPSPTIFSITLVPLDAVETGGRFRVWLLLRDKNVLLWDRKTEGGFPELKVLKQRLRDEVDPARNLGHSDAQKK